MTNKSESDIKEWDQLDIDENILRGIYGMGFERPSIIQQKAIIPIILKQDLIAQAQSGTGKTAAFSIGALSAVNMNEKTTQVLILSPTKELTMQTATVVKRLGQMMPGLNVQTLYGGVQSEMQTITTTPTNPFFNNNSNSNVNVPHIICGCPGKVYDWMKRNKIMIDTIKLIIMDEADELLSFGFDDQIYNIFKKLNSDVQVALFSATLPTSVQKTIKKIMRNPISICVNPEQLTLDGIAQYYIAVEDDRQKYTTLKNLYSGISMSQCIIYCNSVKRVSDLYDAMKEDEFPVSKMHSNMDKVERENAFLEFKSGKSRVLISSNVTARGIDIQQVSVVINFDIPNDVCTYLHRIGRSGRWGRKGVSINLITRRDVVKMKEIETYYACDIKQMPVNMDFGNHI
jgi:superfamily II DNA/RNA helicase